MRYKIIPLLLAALCAKSFIYAQPAAYSPTTKVSYVRIWDAVMPDANPADFIISNTPQQAKITTQFVDGLGQPIQTVVKQGSMITGNNPVDMVSPVVYDEFGREQYKYLPFASNQLEGSTGGINDGSFKLNPFQQQTAFSASQYPGESFYYSQTQFEASPLNRVTKTFAAGNSWVGASRGMEQKYWFNTTADAVKLWTVTNGSNITDFGTYSTNVTYGAGQLYKNVTVDEHGKQVIEFKDKEGLVILKRVQLTSASDDGTGSISSYDNDGHWLCTYYIYDDLNQLRCVIQPEAVKTLAANSWDLNYNSGVLLAEQCFRYEYDARGRMIMKKVPGAVPVYMVYDARDRLVMTQDGNLRANNKWLVTLYDEMNRAKATGLLLNTYSNNSFAQHLDAAYNSTAYPFASSTEPSSAYWELLTGMFYDNYNWLSTNGNVFSTEMYHGDDGSFLPPGNSQYPYPQPITQSAQTAGMVTGALTKVLGTSSQYLYSINYYDDKGRVLQTQAYNVTNGWSAVTNQYNFSDQLLINYNLHGNNNPGATQAAGVLTKYEYDDLGRMKNIKKTIYTPNGVGNMAEKTIVQNEYDALGQLKKKKLGTDPNNTNNPLESLTYDYNIRGWMLGANRDYAKDATNANWFGFDLGYDKTNNGIIGNQPYANPQYNGNIEGMVWKSRGDGEKRKYDFAYDAANRLMNAGFSQYTNGIFNQDAGINYNVKMGDGVDPTLAYDANGNILQMQQWGLKINGSNQLDNLRYTYLPGSNKLKSVTDFNNDAQTKLGDFKTNTTHPQNASKSALTMASPQASFDAITDYTYDDNGNLILDNNKAISNITYNYLNLPETITIAGKGTITYTYDAAGNKLKKTVTENNATVHYNGADYTSNIITTTTYINSSGAVYESKTYSNGSLYALNYPDKRQFFSQEEGRIRWNEQTGLFALDYFLKDHLGNVRAVLTGEQKTDPYPAATMETAQTTTEEQLYTNLPQTRFAKSSISGYPNDTYTDPNDYVAKTNGNGNKIGPSIVLKVMAGDKFNLRVNSWYKTNGATPGTPVNPLNDLIAALAGSVGSITAAHGGTTIAEITNSGIMSPNATQFLNSQTYNSSKPKAYVNWIFLDEQIKYYAGSAEQVGDNEEFKTHLFTDVPISKSGYLYIYVSNETPNIDVFFDNLQVTHIRGPLLEETHYYPFGLIMKGISSKALSFGGIENKYKYNNGNELQSNEFSDGRGLEMFDAVNRLYDPQIGRFWQVDELAESTWEGCPYEFALNNPILFNDPLGLDPETGLTPETAKQLPEAIVVSAKGLWANTRLYYQIMDLTKGDLSKIVNNSLREKMYRIDGIVKHRERVAEMTRESDKVTLEVGSWVVPMGWLTKLKYVRYAAKLFKWKRGKTVIKATEEIVETVLQHSDDAATSANKLRKAVGAAQANFDKVLQSGGNTLNKSTLKALGLTKEEGKIAIEALKKDLGLRSDFHGKIMGNGDLRNSVGEVLGNLFDYLP